MAIRKARDVDLSQLKSARFECFEKLGFDRVKHDLLNGGLRWVGGTLAQQEEAWGWVRMKEAQALLANQELTAPRVGSDPPTPPQEEGT